MSTIRTVPKKTIFGFARWLSITDLHNLGAILSRWLWMGHLNTLYHRIVSFVKNPVLYATRKIDRCLSISGTSHFQFYTKSELAVYCSAGILGFSTIHSERDMCQINQFCCFFIETESNEQWHFYVLLLFGCSEIQSVKVLYYIYFIGYNPIISHFYNITDATKTRRPSILALGGKKQKSQLQKIFHI